MIGYNVHVFLDVKHAKVAHCCAYATCGRTEKDPKDWRYVDLRQRLLGGWFEWRHHKTRIWALTAHYSRQRRGPLKRLLATI
jgi:hypothetical protein